MGIYRHRARQHGCLDHGGLLPHPHVLHQLSKAHAVKRDDSLPNQRTVPLIAIIDVPRL